MSTEIDNRMMWDGSSKGHYEVWYLTGNGPDNTGYWIRYTLEAPLHEAPYAQIWFARFDKTDPDKTIAINRRFPVTRPSSRSPFSFCVGDSELRHNHATGSIAGDGHEVSWDLCYTPAAVTLRQLPPIFYQRGGLADTTVLTPNPLVRVRGQVVVDGQTVSLDGSHFCQTHLWGKKHAFAWAWGHCHAFQSDDNLHEAVLYERTMLETLCVRLKRGPVVLPRLTLVTVIHDGQTYALNRLRDLPKNRGSWSTGRFHFLAQGPLAHLEGTFTCRPEDMVLAEYQDPDGERAYCANTEVGDLTMVLAVRDRARSRFGKEICLSSTGGAHFEIASREADPAIGKLHRAL